MLICILLMFGNLFTSEDLAPWRYYPAVTLVD